MAETASFMKDPDAVLDYAVDWTEWLDGDTIVTSTWTASTGITVDADTVNGAATVTTVWLSGGTVGATYTATNRVTTAAGRTDDRTLSFLIGQR